MKNLIVLELAFNKLEGQLPMCLSNLTSLHTLYLANNSFEGNFPSSIFYTLSSLVAVLISDDYFSGSFPLSSLATHSNLKFISIECSNTNLKVETENPPFILPFN